MDKKTDKILYSPKEGTSGFRGLTRHGKLSQPEHVAHIGHGQPEPEESQDELWDEVEDILTNPARAAVDITHYFTIQRKKQ